MMTHTHCVTGNHEENSVVVWDLSTGTAVATAQSPSVTHDVAFNPKTKREFVTIGAGTIVFWLISENLELLV